MNTIDVCPTPDLIHLYEIRDKVVVVTDIFRATSCIVTAFAYGVEHIVPLADLNQCRAMKVKGYLISGEYDGMKIDGFDKGNSPFEYMDEDIKGSKIALTTTNGTRAIEKSKNAQQTIIGSFLNFDAVVNYLLTCHLNILIVCAGWKGKESLEDSFFAGALVEKLKNHVTAECDAPIIAQQLYRANQGNMMPLLQFSSHTKRLRRLNLNKDIEFCITPNRYDVIPVLKKDRLKLL